MDCVERIYGAEQVLHIGHGLRYDMPVDSLLRATEAEIEVLKKTYACFVTKHAFALHRLLDLPYVGFVRNPLNWYISSYFWAKKTSLGDPSEPYGYNIDKYNLSLEGFIHWLHDIGHDNIQCKSLIQLQSPFTDGMPPRPSEVEMNGVSYGDATALIKNYFTVFAPTEMFSHAVYIMGATFNWPHLPLWRVRSSGEWKSTLVMPPKLEEYIAERSSYDWKLYHESYVMIGEAHASLLETQEAAIEDYDTISKNPAFDDANPFHFRDIEPKIISGWQQPAVMQQSKTPYSADNLALATIPIPSIEICSYGCIHGHLVTSDLSGRPPYSGIPLTYLFSDKTSSLPASIIFRPGVLIDDDIQSLRQRLSAGEAPSLVETFNRLWVWFYDGQFRFIEADHLDVTEIYLNPQVAFADCPSFSDWKSARQILKLFTTPFELERIADYQIVESGREWQALPSDPKLPAYKASLLIQLLQAMFAEKRLRLTAPPPLEIDSLLTYNLILHEGQYFAAKQGEGLVEDLLAEESPGDRLLSASSLIELRRKVINAWWAALPQHPFLIESIDTSNVILYRDTYYLLPQAKGAFDPAQARLDPEVKSSRSLKRLRLAAAGPSKA